MGDYKHSAITEKIIGCALKVHNILGNGFPEIIYHRALDVEMKKQGMEFINEQAMPVYYEGERIGIRRVDFLVENQVLIELIKSCFGTTRWSYGPNPKLSESF